MYLRARWYNAKNGSFVGVDPFAGFAQQPYSLHQYQYGYSSPTNLVDRTGRCAAPPRNSGNVICIALFISTPSIGPDVWINASSQPVFGVTPTKFALPIGVGDGRSFSSDSLSVGDGNYPVQGGSRAYLYLFMDDCGSLTRKSSRFNRSYVLGGYFGMGFGPYPEAETFDAEQKGDGTIDVVWNLPNGASAWARQNQQFWQSMIEQSNSVPGSSDAQASYSLADAFYRATEWAIGLDNINGELSISRTEGRPFPYDVSSMSRDPYPSLEVYHYQNGFAVDTLLKRPETSAGPYIGLRPDAPRDIIP